MKQMIHPLAAGVLALLAACGKGPASADVEATAMRAQQSGDQRAERRLALWAEEGRHVAERELGILYLSRPQQAGAARRWLERAARDGDIEAAFRLGELARSGSALEASAWYRQAAQAGHARAALMLGLMLMNGEGLPVNRADALRWLEAAARGGNAHAMFLLSNAYADGDGAAADPVRARALLERAADLGYPAALQQLALVNETGDAVSPRDQARAAELMKEASEHRRSNAMRY